MEGGLSQDEINALLAGMNLSDDESENTENSEGVGGTAEEGELLSDMEKDAIGEIGNISMGSSATTLYSLVSKKVNITTPEVELIKWDDLMNQYERPCVFIQIRYTVGLDGTNILILKEHDVKVITDLMMGGEGVSSDDGLSELHLSAISEAMNQMMGAAATSLSTMLGQKIDISPPEAMLLDLAQVKDGTDISDFLGGTFVKISFRMQIGDDNDILVDSSIMQLYPVTFARKVVDIFMGTQTTSGETSKQNDSGSGPAAPSGYQTGMEHQGMNAGMNSQMGMGMNQMGMDPQGMNGQGMNAFGMPPQMGMNMGMNPQMGMNMGMNPQMGMNMGMPPQMGMNMGMNPQMGMGMNAQGMNAQGMNGQGMNAQGMNGQGMNGQGMNGQGMNAFGMYPQMGMGMNPQMAMQNVNVQPAQFQSFTGGGAIAGQENIGLIMDVPLNVTVELGRTSKLISEILNFAPGTIIELERIAGEPIDVLVNGKLVAKGEVVVIEECFSVRITEIIK